VRIRPRWRAPDLRGVRHVRRPVGARTGRVVLLQDVTDRQVREERLEEFASVVSHDLRNPLNVARGHLELGRESGDDAHFETVDAALDRMERIIEDLLTLAREGDTDVDGETVSLAEVARTAWDAVDTMDADATLDVQNDGPVVADETALLRLLENLFRNAVEHGSTGNQNAGRSGDAVEHGSPRPASNTRRDAVEHGTTSPDGAPTGSVTVTVGTTDDGFFVADDGPGIPGTNASTSSSGGRPPARTAPASVSQSSRRSPTPTAGASR